MDRAFYTLEMGDPDLDWLLTNFLEMNPSYVTVEEDMLPIVLMPTIEIELGKNVIEGY